MSAAERMQVRLDGVGAVVGDDVVELAAGRSSAAAREAAGAVLRDDVAPQPRRRLVPGRTAVHVDLGNDSAVGVEANAFDRRARISEYFAAQRGGDRAVADQLTRQ